MFLPKLRKVLNKVTNFHNRSFNNINFMLLEKFLKSKCRRNVQIQLSVRGIKGQEFNDNMSSITKDYFSIDGKNLLNNLYTFYLFYYYYVTFNQSVLSF